MNMSEGGAQPNISKIKVQSYPIPLPPLAEQRRIVARVDELMALVDQLEAQQAQASALGAQVLDAVVVQ
jgi:type I restriction enzyme S subunit